MITREFCIRPKKSKKNFTSKIYKTDLEMPIIYDFFLLVVLYIWPQIMVAKSVLKFGLNAFSYGLKNMMEQKINPWTSCLIFGPD